MKLALSLILLVQLVASKTFQYNRDIQKDTFKAKSFDRLS